MARDNKPIGVFHLMGIPPAPRGVPQVEVTFDIDANGILNVSAKDLGTGKEQKIEIKSGSGLADEEVERMVKDAEAHAEDDRRQREIASGNKTLGKFHLDGISPAQRGTPQIEVTFDIDANGIVHVSAKDLGTGKEQKITITASSGLDKNEVDRMVRDAESHAAEDKERREAAETRNRADQLVYQVEKSLQEAGDKLPADERGPVEEALRDAKSALEGGDAAAIRASSERLEKASHRLAEAVYRASAAPQGAEAASPGKESSPGGQDDVIDAEVVDADDRSRS